MLGAEDSSKQDLARANTQGAHCPVGRREDWQRDRDGDMSSDSSFPEP